MPTALTASCASRGRRASLRCGTARGRRSSARPPSAARRSQSRPRPRLQSLSGPAGRPPARRPCSSRRWRRRLSQTASACRSTSSSRESSRRRRESTHQRSSARAPASPPTAFSCSGAASCPPLSSWRRTRSSRSRCSRSSPPSTPAARPRSERHPASPRPELTERGLWLALEEARLRSLARGHPPRALACQSLSRSRTAAKRGTVEGHSGVLYRSAWCLCEVGTPSTDAPHTQIRNIMICLGM
mmetsp:Transcript_49310/g.158736  ORF Transcript_49310/g.158736 Transcript_49310/m.158736 type:complete len:244 (-) Transcript_49310:3-734(-)